jgi:hypothetical protein
VLFAEYFTFVGERREFQEPQADVGSKPALPGRALS